MSVLTDFFVASVEELRAAFSCRVPVKPKPIRKKAKNPFTGQMATTEEWVPAEKFPANCGTPRSQAKQER